MANTGKSFPAETGTRHPPGRDAHNQHVTGTQGPVLTLLTVTRTVTWRDGHEQLGDAAVGLLLVLSTLFNLLNRVCLPSLHPFPSLRPNGLEDFLRLSGQCAPLARCQVPARLLTLCP